MRNTILEVSDTGMPLPFHTILTITAYAPNRPGIDFGRMSVGERIMHNYIHAEVDDVSAGKPEGDAVIFQLRFQIDFDSNTLRDFAGFSPSAHKFLTIERDHYSQWMPEKNWQKK
jgi:hypothetical protein